MNTKLILFYILFVLSQYTCSETIHDGVKASKKGTATGPVCLNTFKKSDWLASLPSKLEDRLKAKKEEEKAAEETSEDAIDSEHPSVKEDPDRLKPKFQLKIIGQSRRFRKALPQKVYKVHVRNRLTVDVDAVLIIESTSNQSTCGMGSLTGVKDKMAGKVSDSTQQGVTMTDCYLKMEGFFKQNHAKQVKYVTPKCGCFDLSVYYAYRNNSETILQEPIGESKNLRKSFCVTKEQKGRRSRNKGKRKKKNKKKKSRLLTRSGASKSKDRSSTSSGASSSHSHHHRGKRSLEDVSHFRIKKTISENLYPEEDLSAILDENTLEDAQVILSNLYNEEESEPGDEVTMEGDKWSESEDVNQDQGQERDGDSESGESEENQPSNSIVCDSLPPGGGEPKENKSDESSSDESGSDESNSIENDAGGSGDSSLESIGGSKGFHALHKMIDLNGVNEKLEEKGSNAGMKLFHKGEKKGSGRSDLTFQGENNDQGHNEKRNRVESDERSDEAESGEATGEGRNQSNNDMEKFIDGEGEKTNLTGDKEDLNQLSKAMEKGIEGEEGKTNVPVVKEDGTKHIDRVRVRINRRKAARIAHRRQNRRMSRIANGRQRLANRIANKHQSLHLQRGNSKATQRRGSFIKASRLCCRQGIKLKKLIRSAEHENETALGESCDEGSRAVVTWVKEEASFKVPESFCRRRFNQCCLTWTPRSTTPRGQLPEDIADNMIID